MTWRITVYKRQHYTVCVACYRVIRGSGVGVWGWWCQRTNVNQENCYRHSAGRTWSGETWRRRAHPTFPVIAESEPPPRIHCDLTRVMQTQGRPAGGRSEHHWKTSVSPVPQLIYLCVDGILRVFIVFIYLLAAEFTLPAVRLHSLALNVVIEKMLLTFVCLFLFFIAIVGLGGNRTEGSGKSCDWIIGLLCLFTK